MLIHNNSTEQDSVYVGYGYIGGKLKGGGGL